MMIEALLTICSGAAALTFAMHSGAEVGTRAALIHLGEELQLPRDDGQRREALLNPPGHLDA